jgi:hypothetical protein
MDAMLPDGWADFGVAAAGATAALTGLVVVAISVNIKEILALPAVVPRAGATIAGLVVGVLASLAFLIPRQTLLAFGVEALVVTAIAVIIEANSLRAHLRDPERPIGEKLQTTLLSVLQFAPLLVGGVLMAGGNPIGVLLIAVGIATTVIASMVNTWILLIEILR